jgi:pimeloyl-ACP methyl ester carboxylesterase
VALLLSETFTGTNGDPWDADWTDIFSAGNATIQGNRGRITTSGDTIMWADTVTLGTNYDVRCDLIIADSTTGWIDFAADFSTTSTGNGHEVELNQSANTVTIYTINSYVGGGSPVSTSYTFASTDTVHVHIRVRGTACWVRVWKNAEDEPLAWQLTTTLTYTNTEVTLGANGAGGVVDFDNFLAVSDRLVTKTIDTGWAGSGDLIILSNSHPTWTGQVKAIIWKHGGLGGNAEEVDSWNLYLDIISDTNGRYVLYAADDGFGGNGAAGNDTELGSLDAVYARAQTDEPDFPKVALAAHSLGGMGIVNWAYRNSGDVAGMVGVDVILDAAQQNTNDGGTFVTNVLDPAYGGSGTWATNASTRDPEDLAVASSALRAIPFQIYDATGDAVLSSNVMSNYVTSHGANATRTTVASGDHGTVHNFIDVPTLITFIEGLTFSTPSDPAPPPLWSYRSSTLRR